jgi:hypothetical protein
MKYLNSNSQPSSYHFDGFELNLNEACYLVTVSVTSEKRLSYHTVRELPSWVFQSKLAIWIMDEGPSILDRSLAAERIRQALSQLRNPNHPQENPAATASNF